MAVYIHKKTRNLFCLHRRIAEDETISLAAKGFICYLIALSEFKDMKSLSLPEEEACLQELEAAGYVEIHSKEECMLTDKCFFD